MIYSNDWAVVVPMANEAADFDAFIAVLSPVLDRLGGGRVYFVVDTVSKDNTRQLCDDLAARDGRFVTIWAPENKNVVDAYLRGFRAAYDAGHEIIIEMDGGLSHDPRALPQFLRVLSEGNECAFGSRFFDYLSANEELGARFQDGMSNLNAVTNGAVAAIWRGQARGRRG